MKRTLSGVARAALIAVICLVASCAGAPSPTRPSVQPATASPAAISQRSATAAPIATPPSPPVTARETATPTPVAPPAAPVEPRVLGRILYIKGSVSIRRGDRLLAGESLGGRLGANDLLATERGAQVEVELGGTGKSAADPGRALLKAGEGTAFSVDAAELADGSSSDIIRLIAGSLSLGVEEAGAHGLGLDIGEVSLGAESATFAVDAAPDGSLLVTCTAGRVSCRAGGDIELSARPGWAVEKVGGSAGLTPVAVPIERLAAFRASWILDRAASQSAGRTSREAGR